MGGFASLMLASFFDRASAIVEVPQLNFMNYPFESAKKLVEDCLLEDISLKQLFSRFPERLSVVERFAKNKRIPNIKVLSNTSDEGFNELLELVNSIEKLRDRVSSYGDFQIQIMAETIGHKPLQTAQVIPIIQQYIAENKMFNTKLIHNPSQEIDGDYKATLDNALAFASKVKYIRTDEDSKNYEKSLSELYRAAAINQKADWPFLKICSMLKLWNNSFNAELFDAAKKALERKETLEGFIYFCRGALFNLEIQEAQYAISERMRLIESAEISNVGNIFLSICSYELGDFVKYRQLIKVYKENESSDNKPYISIPVSTVYAEEGSAPENYSVASLNGHKLAEPDIFYDGLDYIVSISCDLGYLKIYGKYLVKSFSALCGNEALLHIAVLCKNDNEQKEALSLIDLWEGKNVKVTPCLIGVEKNLGPVASLLRFSYIYPLLVKSKLPIVVLDLDTLIKKPLSIMINRHRSSDICSRILGYGVAPWEKFTGGFSIFYPTEGSMQVAKNITFTAEKLCNDDGLQWWIDQNCFEAGIRLVKERGIEINIANVFNERDEFCVMPVGSKEAKLFTLENALASQNLSIN